MNRGWLVACTAAEAVGMTAAAAAARGSMAMQDHGLRFAVPLGLGLVVLGGLVEGAALGWLQSRALAPRLGARGQARWFAGTLLMAGVGWALASTPGALASPTGNSQPPVLLVVAGAAGLGALMGAILGRVQAWAWSGRVRHPGRWVLASCLGWAAAMPVIFLGATLVPGDWSTLAVAGVGTLTGAAAGCVLGLVTMPFLASLDGPPLRHRIVLSVLGTRLVHPVDRDGDGALVGLCVTGSSTGRRYRFPVAAARPDADRLVVLPGHPDRKTWWRNLASRPDVEVLVDGHWQAAMAEVLRCGDPRWEAARASYVARFPRVQTSGEPLVVLRLSHRDQGPVTAGPAAVGGVSQAS